MKTKLLELLEKSYAPYSKFRVSAIVVTKDDKCYSGVNIENASYGATVCAERVAIFKAERNGYKKGDFKELYVMVNSGEIGTPCFACRQVISELFDKGAIVHCCSTIGKIKDYTVEELCPYPFGSDDLR